MNATSSSVESLEEKTKTGYEIFKKLISNQDLSIFIHIYIHIIKFYFLI